MPEYPKISLAAARVNACLTQEEAAKRIGVDVSSIINYEKGKTVPSWDKVQKIAEVYNFPASYISFGR